jgi:acetoacetate decarboxylase
MRLEPGRHYRMPLLMGPMFDRASPPKFDYPHVDVLAFRYLTRPEAIAPLLPESYRPAKEPLVTVLFSQNNGLDFMAGAGYRLAAFQVAARFEGTRDRVEGDYILVMFEDQTWPIVGGREDLGVQKAFADISPFKLFRDGRTRCEASLWGHLLVALELPPLKRQSAIVRAVATRKTNSRPWLGYKYIGSLDGPPDADYPTITRNDTRIEALWLGKQAGLRFGDAGRDDVGYMRPLLDALSTLAVVKPVQAVRFTGSSVLRYDLSHRLR